MTTSVATPVVETAAGQPEQSVTLRLADLLEVVTDLLGSVASFGRLAGVLLHTTTHEDQAVLVGHSSDRFILAQAWAPLTSPATLPETYITACQAQVIQTLLGRSCDHGDHDDPWGYHPNKPIRVTRDDDAGVLVVQVGDRYDEDVTIRLELADQEEPFPVLRDKFDVPRFRGRKTTLHACYLRHLADVADRRDEQVELMVSGRDKSVHVAIGQRYRAVVAPFKTRPDATVSQFTSSPLFIPPGESSPVEQGEES
jgi:hypothetical protein